MSSTPEIVTRTMDAVGVDPELRALVDALAERRTVTCAERTDYAGVRPAGYGAIAVHVNPHNLDVRLPIHRANEVEAGFGLEMTRRNGSNGIVRLVASDVGRPNLDFDQVVDLLVEACDARDAGPDFRAAARGAARTEVTVGVMCPNHGVELDAQGECVFGD